MEPLNLSSGGDGGADDLLLPAGTHCCCFEETEVGSVVAVGEECEPMDSLVPVVIFSRRPTQ